MSGLYLIGVVTIWLLLTVSLWKRLRRWRNETVERKKMRDMIALVVGVLWISASFWYAGGRKLYYDWQVTRMCAVDGGIRVYETVKWPADRFDKWGNIGVPNRQHAKVEDEYYFEKERTYLRTGNPKLVRSVTRVIRRSDGKVLGESIRYGRSGGDMPGPWHPSRFSCPSIPDLRLDIAIFKKGIDK